MEAEKILKEENERNFKNQEKLSAHSHNRDQDRANDDKKNFTTKKSINNKKKAKNLVKKKMQAKKVSKK